MYLGIFNIKCVVMYFYCLVFLVIVLSVLLNCRNQRENVFLIPIWKGIIVQVLHLKYYVKHSVIITNWGKSSWKRETTRIINIWRKTGFVSWFWLCQFNRYMA